MALFVHLQAAEDATERRKLRSEIVELNLDIARGVAWRYRGRGEPLEDLQQVAFLGLVHAVARYDPSRGTPFQVFATPTITGEVKKYFRDRAWTIRPPRRIQNLQVEIAAILPELQHRLQGSPTARHVAEALDQPEEEVIEALAADGCFAPASLDAPASIDPTVVAVGDLLGAPDPAFTRLETGLTARDAYAQLGVEDRRLVEMRFVEELSQREISEQIGVNQMAVSRALSRILSTMREHLET